MKTRSPENLVTPPSAKLAMNRRHQRRISIHIPLRIYCPGDARDRYHVGTCTSLSDSGLAFDTDAVLDMTEPLEIEFHQPGHPAFRREVSLLYRMGTRYGAYFADLHL